ncbi:MAG: methyltransferase domain-containing protein [Gammaproteobacteria bacterium]|nr:methyltransferase domain-containing protein [Gammaproteobacteria bacterium]
MHEVVKEYYGKNLESNQDLKTAACCDASAQPTWLKPLLATVHPEVLERYYGCGLICPPLLKGCSVLDLGCGAGRDVYVLSQLVGAEGCVVGIDMTQGQLDIARRHRKHHADSVGYDNVMFVEGILEDLDSIGLEAESFDVVVSNCVLNLATDKGAVLGGVMRVLKPGGEFYFSDVYADRRLPEEVRRDKALYGECLGGALYWNDFIQLAKRQGFLDPRLVCIDNREIDVTPFSKLTKGTRFFSATYRLFKLDGIEAFCEDYGQAVCYRGTIADHPHSFTLDDHHVMEAGRIFLVCGNTYRMLHDTRFIDHFDFFGTFAEHFGIFEGCGVSAPVDGSRDAPAQACC